MVSYQVAIQKATKGDLQSIPQKKPCDSPPAVFPRSQKDQLFFEWLVGGWPTPLKNDGVKVSWDDDIPNTIWLFNIIATENHHF